MLRSVTTTDLCPQGILIPRIFTYEIYLSGLEECIHKKSQKIRFYLIISSNESKFRYFTPSTSFRVAMIVVYTGTDCHHKSQTQNGG